jgi:hypothetical protein
MRERQMQWFTHALFLLMFAGAIFTPQQAFTSASRPETSHGFVVSDVHYRLSPKDPSRIHNMRYERADLEIPNELAAVREKTEGINLVTRNMIASGRDFPVTRKSAKKVCHRIPELAEIQFRSAEIDYGCRVTLTSDNPQEQVVPAIRSRNSKRGESNDVPALNEFRRSVTNGKSDQLTGIWVEGILAFRVLSGTSNVAPSVRDTASIYDWADRHGVTGLLIHNYLGGTQIYQLNPGVKIAGIYGNGSIDWYVSRGGKWYETMTKSSTGIAGPFRNWACTDCKFNLRVRDIHRRHYTGSHHLAFQTSVEVGGRFGVMIVDAYYSGVEETNFSTLIRDINYKMAMEALSW